MEIERDAQHAAEPASVEPDWSLSEHLQESGGNMVVSRRPGQAIFLGEDGLFKIRIMLLEVGGTQVRLGIKADRRVKILRGELLRKEQPPPAS